jgi:phage anti-repressor protein
VSLKQLVDMLYRIEKGTHQLRVTRLQVKKRFKDPHSFDVTATVSMILSKET